MKLSNLCIRLFLATNFVFLYPLVVGGPLQKSVIDDLLKPVDFTQEGFAEFFHLRFNTASYVPFLSTCFVHIEDFLKFAPYASQPEAFAIMTLELFAQRFSSRWANPFALIDLLEHAEPLLAQLCNQQAQNNEKKQQIKSILYNAILQRFSDLKSDPGTFLDSLAAEIISLQEKDDKSVELRDLQYAALRFLEKILSRLVWDARDQEYVWQSVIRISELLKNLSEKNCFPDDRHLDQLYWALTHSFSYFIEQEGALLDLSCYETIKSDLMGKGLCLTSIEAEDLMLNKREFLLSALLAGEMKARARQRGILSLPDVYK